MTYVLPAPTEAPTSRERLRLVLLLGALIALGPLTIDMYLPSLPTITEELATTAPTVQLTLTGTLLGLALGTAGHRTALGRASAAGCRCSSEPACTWSRRC